MPFAGFDRSAYPGDRAMAALFKATNLIWCGYYLAPAPSHPDASWMGKRGVLAGQGWGLAPIYVGQQVTGPGSKHPSAQNGLVDGNAAARLMTGEGFTPGSWVYLDLENGPPLPPSLANYVGAWCTAVCGHGYNPGIYTSHSLAKSVASIVSGSGINIRIWAFKVATTAAHPHKGTSYPAPSPAGSGYASAYMWQLEQNCEITVAGAPAGMSVDLSSALSADPSF